MAAVASGRSSWQSRPLFVAVLLFSVLAASFANAQPAYGYDGPSSIYDGPVNVARGEVVAVGSDAISVVAGVDRDSGYVYDSSANRYATRSVAAAWDDEWFFDYGGVGLGISGSVGYSSATVDEKSTEGPDGGTPYVRGWGGYVGLEVGDRSDGGTYVEPNVGIGLGLRFGGGYSVRLSDVTWLWE